MPHHWSVLSSVALAQLPSQLRSATAAFVMPSAVDGRPAYVRDPLANDQDWALTLYLRYLRSVDGWPATSTRILRGEQGGIAGEGLGVVPPG